MTGRGTTLQITHLVNSTTMARDGQLSHFEMSGTKTYQTERDYRRKTTGAGEATSAQLGFGHIRTFPLRLKTPRKHQEAPTRRHSRHKETKVPASPCYDQH